MNVSIAPAGNAAPKPPGVKESFVASAAAATVKATGKKRPIINRGDDEDQGRWVKILGFGDAGSGKTFFIVGLLEAGLKILVVSTDLGGSGLASVYNELDRRGLKHLRKNIVELLFPDYTALTNFFRKPESLKEEGFDLFVFRPDFMVWDGFTGFQQTTVQNFILDEITPATKNASEGRQEGLWAEQQDWGMIRNATVRSLNSFLGVHDWVNGRAIHKYVTCLGQKSVTDKLTGKTQRAPYVQGSAGALMGPAFDIIMEFRVKGDSPNLRYEYGCVGDEKFLGKARGFPLDPVEPADSKSLWLNKIAPYLNPVVKPEEKPNE